MTYTAPKPQAYALFGKAVAVIGDLNRDGFNGMWEEVFQYSTYRYLRIKVPGLTIAYCTCISFTIVKVQYVMLIR